MYLVEFGNIIVKNSSHTLELEAFGLTKISICQSEKVQVKIWIANIASSLQGASEMSNGNTKY